MSEEKIVFSDSNTSVGDSATVTKEDLGEKQWYIATTYATREEKVAENIRSRIQNSEDGKYIFRVLVPMEEVEVKDSDGNIKGTKQKPYLKGYIFIEMYMTDKAWYLVRNTPGVTGFVGSSGKGTKPFPVTREEMEPILKRAGEIDDDMYKRYAVGDYIKVIHGPLIGTEGEILAINRETNEVSIKALFFGKETIMDVDFSDIEKI